MAAVLIADDESTIRQLLRHLLGVEGYDVAGEAGDGLEAIERVDDLGPDVVVMDYMMPRMDGAAATREVKRRHPDVAVIAFTAIDEPRVRAAMLAAGADCHAMKGHLDDLLECLRRVTA